MSRSRSLLAVAAGAALVALVAFAWRSTSTARAPIADRDSEDLATPSAERLAALERAEAEPAHTIESQSGTAREALEVRKIQTRSASITVQPPKVEGENRGMIIVWCYLEASRANIDAEEIELLASDGRALGRLDEQPKGTFRGLAKGTYSVLVRDPGFESVRVDSVATGSHVLIDLVGTVRLRARALDVETGAAIDTSALRLVDFGREKEFPPDVDGWFTGLPGGNLELRVATDGYEDSKLVAQGLVPGESREVEVHFSRAGEIRGVVVSDTSGAPVANVPIRFDPVETPDAASERTSRADVSNLRDRLRPALPVFSDAQGRFTIEDLRLGEYSLSAGRVSLPESVGQRVVLTAASRVKEVVLRAPESCTLSGTLTVRGGDADWASLVGMRVFVKRLGLEDPNRFDGNTAQVGPGGQFRFASVLPVERVELRLAMRSQRLGFDAGAASVGARVLGELTLHPGENECSFDVSELLPGFADVEVATGGLELEDGALLVGASLGGVAELYELRRGQGRVGPLPPGDYWVLARGDRSWLSSTPAALRIERGKPNSLRMELQLVRGSLLVQDESGVALAEHTVVPVRIAGYAYPGARGPIRAIVGENGELVLALEPGSYLIGGQPDLIGGQPERTLEWGAAGPVQRVLRIDTRR